MVWQQLRGGQSQLRTFGAPASSRATALCNSAIFALVITLVNGENAV
jgi:hypothetical protein